MYYTYFFLLHLANQRRRGKAADVCGGEKETAAVLLEGQRVPRAAGEIELRLKCDSLQCGSVLQREKKQTFDTFSRLTVFCSSFRETSVHRISQSPWPGVKTPSVSASNGTITSSGYALHASF